MAAAFKAKQDEIRRLMKERRENLKDYKNRIESPFAKYNSLGQLFCTICNIQIKNNGLWASHVAGKIHKENAVKKKKGPANIASKTVPPVKEKRCEDMPPPAKKLKVDASETTPVSQKTEPVQTSGKISLLGVYSSSDSEDDTEPMDVSNDVPNNNALPKDFFDAAPSLAFPVNGEQSSTEQKKPVEAPVNSVDALPEGFFDDPVQDAKVLCALMFFGSGSFQWVVGQDRFVNLSQPSVSRSVHKVVNAIERRMFKRDISFPYPNEYPLLKQKFMQASGFPGVIGAIDCTHIKLIAPPEPADANYIDRRGDYSLNVQLARNIEYKDPIEEEWERYQKAIAEETNVSKNIIEEDLEESTLERDITEIDLQINLWEKAKELQTRAEEASSKVPSSNNNDGSSGNTDDEFDEDDLLDWRSKGVRRR